MINQEEINLMKVKLIDLYPKVKSIHMAIANPQKQALGKKTLISNLLNPQLQSWFKNNFDKDNPLRMWQ